MDDVLDDGSQSLLDGAVDSHGGPQPSGLSINGRENPIGGGGGGGGGWPGTMVPSTIFET